MNETSSPTSTLPAFTPVPRQRMRRGGWSAERQRAFIEALAETGSVRAACRRLGVGEHHIYKLRRHPEGESFRKAWEEALDHGIARIEDVAMDRALNGVEQPVYHAGEIVGTRRVYNDRLLMFMLQNRAPERFAGAGSAGKRGLDAVGKMELERLRKKWREEWEAEREAARPSVHEARARIDKMLEDLRQRVVARQEAEHARLSEETRAAWETYQRLRERDLAPPPSPQRDKRKLVNATPPPKKQPKEPKPRKTTWTLKDDGWE